jgi:hypothetical protein
MIGADMASGGEHFARWTDINVLKKEAAIACLVPDNRRECGFCRWSFSFGESIIRGYGPT